MLSRLFRATFDPKDKDLVFLVALQQFVSTFMAEVWEVDRGDRVGCQNLEDGTGGELAQPLLCSENRQWAGKARHVEQ